MPDYLKIIKGATTEQRMEFLMRKEPAIRAAWERYVETLNMTMTSIKDKTLR